MKNRITSLISRFWFILLIIFLNLMWLPLPFIEFDPHHDGLILATINNLDSSLKHDLEWPFNQYGPAWIFPSYFFSKLFPVELTLVSIRFLTIIYYLLSFVATYLLAKKFGDRRFARLVTLGTIITQPFISNLSSDLIPWPSALTMLLIPLVVLLVIESVQYSNSWKASVAGLLTGIAVFTRVQTGISLLIIFTALLMFWKLRKIALFYVFGFILQTLILFIFLASNGWLLQALSDEFIFGSTYLRGDKSTYPKPIFTFVLTVFLIILYYLSQKLKLENINWKKYVFPIVAFVCFFSFFYLFSTRKLTPIQVTFVVFRRFWISLILASILIGISKLNFRKNFSVNENNQKFVLLIIGSLVSELQVYPLFDQMHAWWSITPGIVVAMLILKEIINKISISKMLTKVLISAIILYLVISFINLLSEEKKEISIGGVKYVSTSIDNLNELSYANNFFNSKMKSGSKVLNLCGNANVYFVQDKFIPAARNIVLWHPIYQDSSLRESILKSKPDYVVTCNIVTNQKFLQQIKKDQLFILRKLGFESNSSESLLINGVTTWQIWEKKNY